MTTHAKSVEDIHKMFNDYLASNFPKLLDPNVDADIAEILERFYIAGYTDAVGLYNEHIEQVLDNTEK